MSAAPVELGHIDISVPMSRRVEQLLQQLPAPTTKPGRRWHPRNATTHHGTHRPVHLPGDIAESRRTRRSARRRRRDFLKEGAPIS